MTYFEKQANFVQKVTTWFKSLISFVDLMHDEVKGVSFVPIHRYGTGRAELVDKICVVLGKERGGVYKDRYNFFGGKLEKSWSDSIPWPTVPTAEKVLWILLTLFDEVAEEFGIMLEPEDFIKSCVSVTRHGASLVFWCHMTGVNRGTWTTIMADPKRKTLWKYQEMDAIEHIPVESILGRGDLSSYVVELVGKASMIAKTLDGRPHCRFTDFTPTTGFLA